MSKHRTKKRFFAVGLAFSLVLATFQPVSAVTDTKGHWAERIINEAVANYIMQGSDDGTFKPDKHITREEFFAAVTNILTDKPDTGNTVIKFSDVKEGEWYVPYVKIAVAAGLTSGTGDGAFGIGRNITREEAAKIVAGVVYTEGLTGAGYLAAKDADKVSSWAIKGVDIMYKKGYIKGDESGNFNPQGLLTRAAAAKILLEVKKHENVINSSVNQQLKGEFTKGNGTKENPYQITNSAQLNNVRNFADKKAYFVLKNDIKIVLGDISMLPAQVQTEICRSLDQTKDNTGLIFNLALNYGARAELVEAAKKIAYLVQTHQINLDSIDESTVSKFLYTGELPDPDLLIRTAGDMRISNFLLWQIAYSEIIVTNTLWPDFTEDNLLQAIIEFQNRERRFGGLSPV